MLSLRLCERIGTGMEFLGPGRFHQAQQQMIIELEKIALACIVYSVQGMWVRPDMCSDACMHLQKASLTEY